MSRYMEPGRVNEVRDRPKAPTNSNTAAMSSMKIEARIHPI